MDAAYKKYCAKIGIAWAICFVVFFFLYMLMLAPQKKAKQALQKQLAEKKEMHELAMKATKKENKANLDEQLEQLRNQLGDIVLDFEDSTNLTFVISRIATEKQVSSFSIEAEKQGSSVSRHSKQAQLRNIYECSFDVSFQAANFNQFASLLNTLERNRPPIFINDFTITRADKAGSEHRVKMNLTVFIRKKQQVSVAKLIGEK